MKESIEHRLSRAMKEDQSHQDFLSMLLEDERLYRMNHKSNLLRKRAKFRDRASLEEFAILPERGINKTMIRQLQGLHFMDNFENIIFYGKTGAGKTFLAQAIGHTACGAGRDAIFVSVDILFHQLEIANKNGTYLNLLNRLSRTQLLIIDDFGLRNYSHHEATILCQLLENRYRKNSTIITSQVKPKGWKSLFEDSVIADAIIDRAESCAHLIEIKIKGDDTYRRNFSPKKKISIDG